MLYSSSHFTVHIILFLTGLLAGTVDAIAGGGGMISLPILLGVGVPPHLALGTNKLQGAVGTFVATYNYYRNGFLSLKTVYHGLLFGLIGTTLGVVVSQILTSDILKKIIPLLLLIILIYTLFSPKVGHLEKKPKMKANWFYSIFGFILGFYDGFFGPGTGSFWLFSLTFFLGFNLIKASAYTKIFNLKSNIIATVCFALCHTIDYRIAFCMACGQVIGGKLGAHLAIKNGSHLIRPLFILIISFTIFSILYKNYSVPSDFFNVANRFYVFFILAIIIAIITTFVFLRKSKSRR